MYVPTLTGGLELPLYVNVSGPRSSPKTPVAVPVAGCGLPSNVNVPPMTLMFGAALLTTSDTSFVAEL